MLFILGGKDRYLDADGGIDLKGPVVDNDRDLANAGPEVTGNFRYWNDKGHVLNCKFLST